MAQALSGFGPELTIIFVTDCSDSHFLWLIDLTFVIVLDILYTKFPSQLLGEVLSKTIFLWVVKKNHGIKSNKVYTRVWEAVMHFYLISHL